MASKISTRTYKDQRNFFDLYQHQTQDDAALEPKKIPDGIEDMAEPVSQRLGIPKGYSEGCRQKAKDISGNRYNGLKRMQ